MAKFFGIVGFVKHRETTPGVWSPSVYELKCTGDVTRDIRRNSLNDGVNGTVTFNNVIEIVMNDYCQQHFSDVRYVTWRGTTWEVTSVEVRHPRLLLSLGGVYNGPKT